MMSNKEFLELLNLYIDGEISPEDRERVEREVADNESRRAVYNEYVRLQEATEKLFNHFHTNLTDTVDLKKYHILSRGSEQRYVLGSIYSAAAVFVACLSIFAATRILSDSSGVLMSDREQNMEPELRGEVELVRNPAASRESRYLWRVSGEGQLPPSSYFQSIFSGTPELSSGFIWRHEPNGLSEGGTRVYQSSNSFESPPPDLASFQFQR